MFAGTFRNSSSAFIAFGSRVSCAHAKHAGDIIARTGTEQLCKRYFQDRVLWTPGEIDTRLLGLGLARQQPFHYRGNFTVVCLF
jgi:hypothetical protein